MAAANLSNTTDLNKTHYMREALPIMEYNLVMNKFGQEDEMPRSEGNVFSWIKFTKFDSDSGYTANTTGDSPTWTPDSISTAPITCTPDFLFGNGVEWNSAREYTSWADLPKAMRKNLAVQAAEAIDKRIRDVLVTGTQVIYSGTNILARRDLLSTHVITMKDIFRAAAKLESNGAKPVAKFGKYCAIISPITKITLLMDSTFRDLVEHSRAEDLFAGRIGTLGGVDFWMSQFAPTVSNGGSASSVATIDQTLVFGEGAYGVSKIMFSDFDIVYTAPGGHGDEWKNKHKLTWKAAMKAVILEDLAMVRIESARDTQYSV